MLDSVSGIRMQEWGKSKTQCPPSGGRGSLFPLRDKLKADSAMCWDGWAGVTSQLQMPSFTHYSVGRAGILYISPLPAGFLLISGKDRHPGGDWEEEDSKLQVVLFTFLVHPGPQLRLLGLFSRSVLLVPSSLGTFPPISSVPPAVCGWEGAACCCCSSLCHLTSPLGFSVLSAPPN